MTALRTPLYERTFARLSGAVETLGERAWLEVHRGAGRGVPVLALHGLGSDGRDLAALAAALTAGPRGARRAAPRAVACLDLPGFGRAGRPERAYPVARAAAAALDVQAQLGWPRALWLGCSYGGHVALRAALDAPRRVAALALVASGGLDPAPDPALAAAFAEERLRGRAPGEVAAAVDLLVGRPCDATRAYRAGRLALHGAPLAPFASDVRAVARSAAGALVDDAGARLEQVACPSALVHGALDPLVPPALARSAATRLPGASLTVLPGVGHLPWLEDPAAVAAAVLALHRSLTPDPAAAERGQEV